MRGPAPSAIRETIRFEAWVHAGISPFVSCRSYTVSNSHIVVFVGRQLYGFHEARSGAGAGRLPSERSRRLRNQGMARPWP